MASTDPLTGRVNQWGEPMTEGNATSQDTSLANAQAANQAWTQSTSEQAARITKKDPAVFMGYTSIDFSSLSEADQIRAETGRLSTRTERTMAASEAANQFYDWDQKTKDAFISKLALAGRDVDNLTDGQMAEIWAGYVGQAAAYYKGGFGQTLTPWDILAKDMRSREAAALKPRTVTQTATNLDLSSALTARAIFQQASQALLGRAPTQAEAKAFQAKLNAYERANPGVATTTSNYAGGTGDLVSQSTVSTGGVQAADRAMIAEESAKADPEYGAYQASTSGMNWLMEMVNGG